MRFIVLAIVVFMLCLAAKPCGFEARRDWTCCERSLIEWGMMTAGWAADDEVRFICDNTKKKSKECAAAMQVERAMLMDRLEYSKDMRFRCEED